MDTKVDQNIQKTEISSSKVIRYKRTQCDLDTYKILLQIRRFHLPVASPLFRFSTLQLSARFLQSPKVHSPANFGLSTFLGDEKLINLKHWFEGTPWSFEGTGLIAVAENLILWLLYGQEGIIQAHRRHAQFLTLLIFESFKLVILVIFWILLHEIIMY